MEQSISEVILKKKKKKKSCPPTRKTTTSIQIYFKIQNETKLILECIDQMGDGRG